MNLLCLSAYFSPEKVSSSHLTEDLYASFSKNEINCVCYVPQPTRGVTEEQYENYQKYEELYNGHIKVNRFSMIREGKNPIQRALRYLMCSLKQYYLGVKEKNIDIVYGASTPPTQGMLSAMVAKKLSKKYGKKVPFIYNLQDIFPDSLVNAKLTNRGSIIWKIGRTIENYTYKNADRIIVISESMKKNIVEKGIPREKIEVISNWIDLDQVKPISRNENFLMKKLSLSKNDFIVVYAGNFGEAQGAEIILSVAEKFIDYKNIKFVIFGGGSNFDEFKSKSKNKSNIFVNDLLPLKYVSNVYSLGDIALITCKPGTGNAGMPSKTWSIMACNTPIVASFDVESDLSKILEISKAGTCIESGNVDELFNTILGYYSNRDYKQNVNSRVYISKNMSKDKCLKQYIKLFKEKI